MAIIELKNITGLLEATMSDYIDSAVIKEKTTRKELVSLLQATDESLDTVLNNMEGKVASTNTLQHHLELQKLEIKTLKQKAAAADTLEDKVNALTEENSKLSQELQDTAEKLAKVEAVVKSLEHDLGEAVLEKNNTEERAEKLERELKETREALESASQRNSRLLSNWGEAQQIERRIKAELEEYKSRGFFARIFNRQS
jgi:chromosome segregation ATPase